MVLAELKPGERARIERVTGGRGLKQKLALRGLSEGTWVRVVSSYGPVTVEVGGNTVSLGRGMAREIQMRRR